MLKVAGATPFILAAAATEREYKVVTFVTILFIN